MDTCKIFRDCKTTIPLSSLNVSSLYTIACGFMDIQMNKIGCVGCARLFPDLVAYYPEMFVCGPSRSSFGYLDMCAPVHAIPTFVTEALAPACCLCTDILNDYESEVMAYAVLAGS